MIISNDILDLRDGIGQVGCAFRWELINVEQQVIGEIHPEVGAQMSNDTDATVMRVIRSVKLRESESRDLDIFNDFVRPSMVLEDGTVWPMGVFAFTSDLYTEGSLETPFETSLLDLGYALNQEMPHSFGLADGERIRPAMERILDIYGIVQREVHYTDAYVGGGPINWPPDTTGRTILNSLAAIAGFYAPYFNNDGYLVLRPITALSEGDDVHTYNRNGGRIELNTLTRSTNIHAAPNAYRVLSSGPTTSEIYATAYVDPGQPHSRERRGQTIIKTIRMQGLADTSACLAVAEAHARQDSRQYETLAFSSVVDPRHDTFDTIQIDDAFYREVSWTVDLKPGGTHSHSLVKAQVSSDVNG